MLILLAALIAVTPTVGDWLDHRDNPERVKLIYTSWALLLLLLALNWRRVR